MSAVLLQPRRGRRLSLTALIDVVFILLLFFMVTSVFQREATVELPTASGSAPAQAPRPQVLAVNTDGAIRPWEQPDAWKTLTSLTLEFWETFDPAMPLVVRPAPDCPVETLIRVLEIARAAGFFQVSLGPTWEPPT